MPYVRERTTGVTEIGFPTSSFSKRLIIPTDRSHWAGILCQSFPVPPVVAATKVSRECHNTAFCRTCSPLLCFWWSIAFTWSVLERDRLPASSTRIFSAASGKARRLGMILGHILTRYLNLILLLPCSDVGMTEHRFSFMYQMCWFQISARRHAILTGVLFSSAPPEIFGIVLPHASQFIIDESYHSTFMAWPSDSAVKQTINK
jgi:hypothetical protein